MTQQALDRLDAELRNSRRYVEARQKSIDSLRVLLDAEPDNLPLIMELGDRYAGFDNDSAMTVYKRGSEIADEVNSLPFKWKLASILPGSGFFKEASSIFYGIDTSRIPASMKESFYAAGCRMHLSTADFFDNYPDVSLPNKLAAIDCQEEMLKNLPETSPQYKFRLGEYYYLTGKIDKAEVILDDIVKSEPGNSPFRASAAHYLARIADARDDTDAILYYLATAASARITAAEREPSALQELGTAIYNSGDIKRAYSYLSKAIDDAVLNAAPLRSVDASQTLPILEQAHSHSISQWRRTLVWLIAAVVLLVLGIVALSLVIRRQNTRIGILESHLSDADKTKEIYIGRFLQICSIYMDRLNQFCLMASRKLASGQSDELLQLVRSGKFIEEQSREFYETFDSTFLNIYPDFVMRVNELLLPGKQITLEAGQQFNSDLRILALMRLGIDDSSRIAQILNYSLNTIYSYRNRLKARAIDREHFEADIMKIE